jgi:hypothetical protein
MKEVGATHRTDFTLGEKPGHRDLASSLSKDRNIVMRTAKESSPSPATTKQQRGQGRLRMSGSIGGEKQVEIFARGLRVTDMKLHRLSLGEEISNS